MNKWHAEANRDEWWRSNSCLSEMEAAQAGGYSCGFPTWYSLTLIKEHPQKHSILSTTCYAGKKKKGGYVLSCPPLPPITEHTSFSHQSINPHGMPCKSFSYRQLERSKLRMHCRSAVTAVPWSLKPPPSSGGNGTHTYQHTVSGLHILLVFTYLCCF